MLATTYHRLVIIHAPAFDRRRFLRTLGQGALMAAIPGAVWAEEGETVTISLFHTTDLHGHILPTSDYQGHPDLGGLARCATQIRQWQRANPNSVLLDLGDIYQGTALGLHTQGVTMISCLNGLGYDGWVVGNHEFDWGIEPFSQCVKQSTMPVLSGNALAENVQPWLVKDMAGFRIVIIGLTTPALASWLPPENLRGFESLDPVESLRKILRQTESLKPDAIIVAGHMGLTRRDDHANRVGALTREFPQIAACIGGHTHQNRPGEIMNGVLYTQADHYGIHVGKLELTFHRTTRKLLKREAITVQMDHRIALDPLVLSLTQKERDTTDQLLLQKIGDLTEPLGLASSFGQPSDLERLIASAIRAALTKRGCEVDAVVHGLFEGEMPVAAGMKTVADAWTILPYENQIVTVDLSRENFIALAQDFAKARDVRNIMGVRIVGAVSDGVFQVQDIRMANGAPLPPKETYRVALNSHDSQSAGQKFPVVAKLVASPSNRRVLHPVQTRDALIDYFAASGQIARSSFLV